MSVRSLVLLVTLGLLSGGNLYAWDDGLFETVSKAVAGEQQFMTIPLSSEWLAKKGIDYEISEGWVYSTGEQSIHGLVSHKSIDYAVPYATPVYAPVDGWIQGSYYNTTLGATDNRVIYDGKTVNYGLGYWVQIVYPDPQDSLNPDKVTMIQLAHLSRFAPKISQTIAGKPYVFDSGEDALKINNYSLTRPQLKLILKGWVHDVVHVKRGELIGYAGNSGLEWGEEVVEDYQPKQHLTDPHNSWDETHIHVQIYQRSPEGYKISSSIKDPYNLGAKTMGVQYPTHANNGILADGHLFASSDGRLPDYAK